MKASPCPVCGTLSPFEQPHPEADLYRCPACDHCFSDTGAMARFEAYDPDYYEVTHRNWFAHPHIALFARIYDEIAAVNPHASVLDLGCGRGDLLKYLHGRNPQLELTGIDLSPNAPAEDITFLQGDALTTDFGRTYNAVVNLAVIEHVGDVHAFAQRLAELCTPGGIVVIMTLNDRSVLYGTARGLRRVGVHKPFERLYSKHHLNHFNIRSLRRLVESHGLKVEKTIRTNAPLGAVDFTAASPLGAAVMRAGVWGVFALGRLTGGTYLQTIVCRR